MWSQANHCGYSTLTVAHNKGLAGLAFQFACIALRTDSPQLRVRKVQSVCTLRVTFGAYCKLSCIAPGGLYNYFIFHAFSVCVHMSRNVVVSFAEGDSDDLDDKKIWGYTIFCSRLWWATCEGAIHETVWQFFS